MTAHEERFDADLLASNAMDLVEGQDRLLKDLIGLRKVHRLSQAEVADRMSVSQPTVAAFERYDANPTLSTIRRYALAVHAAIDYQVTDSCSAPGQWQDFGAATIQTAPSRQPVMSGRGEWTE